MNTSNPKDLSCFRWKFRKHPSYCARKYRIMHMFKRRGCLDTDDSFKLQLMRNRKRCQSSESLPFQKAE